MNILILSWRGPGHPLSGGAEQVTWRYATGWVNAGHRVTLITSAYKNCLSSEKLSHVNVVRYGDQFIGCKLFAVFHYLFSGQKYDIVVDEHHGLPFFTPFYVRQPKICFVHEVAGPVWRLNPWPKPAHYIPRVLGPLLEKISLSFYRSVQFLTVSKSSRDDLAKLGIKNIAIINNGVNLPTNIPKLNKNSFPTFIFLSALAHDKGVEDAILVFKSIYKLLPDSKFYIVGHGTDEYVSYLKLQSKNLPITFTGYVSEIEKFKLLAKSHILVFPSAHEGWGLVIIEANAMGTPAVVYPVSGVVDATKDKVTGFVSYEQTPESLSKSALDLFKSPKYSQISKAAQSWAMSFSWDKSIKSSLNLLSKVSKQS